MYKRQQFYLDHSYIELSTQARLLYLTCIAHAGSQQSDGLVRGVFASQFALWINCTGKATNDAFDELVDAKLLDRAPEGWQVCNFLDWQKSADQVKSERVGAAERQRKSRAKRKSNVDVTRDSPVSHAPVTQPETETDTDTESLSTYSEHKKARTNAVQRELLVSCYPGASLTDLSRKEVDRLQEAVIVIESLGGDAAEIPAKVSWCLSLIHI